MEELNKKAEEIISKILYITIATSSKDGKPWNTPVYSAFDDKFNFFWTSWKESQHSKNIQENNNVFLVIYDSTAPEGTGEGVYIQAKAYELSDPEEIKQSLAYLYTRKEQAPDKRKPEEFLGNFPRRVYKAVPEKVWINEDKKVNGNFVDNRIEVELLK
jgi:nitroimidazol reductase NimA-like FMN-containing flavoprotein (pyridoxamine 5'-phosphate oxidase superfamily)